MRCQAWVFDTRCTANTSRPLSGGGTGLVSALFPTKQAVSTVLTKWNGFHTTSESAKQGFVKTQGQMRRHEARLLCSGGAHSEPEPCEEPSVKSHKNIKKLRACSKESEERFSDLSLDQVSRPGLPVTDRWSDMGPPVPTPSLLQSRRLVILLISDSESK